MIFNYNFEWNLYEDKKVGREDFIKIVKNKCPNLTEKDLFIQGNQLTPRGFALLLIYAGVENIWKMTFYAYARGHKDDFIPDNVKEFLNSGIPEMYFQIGARVFFTSTKFKNTMHLINSDFWRDAILQLTKQDSMFVHANVFHELMNESQAAFIRLYHILRTMEIYPSIDNYYHPTNMDISSGDMEENIFVESLIDEIFYNERATFLHNSKTFELNMRPYNVAPRKKRCKIQYDKEGKHIIQNFS